MPQINGISMFHALKKTDENVLFVYLRRDMFSLEQLKGKIPDIEKYAIHKPIFLRNLKDKINELVSEKSIKVLLVKDALTNSNTCCFYENR